MDEETEEQISAGVASLRRPLVTGQGTVERMKDDPALETLVNPYARLGEVKWTAAAEERAFGTPAEREAAAKSHAEWCEAKGYAPVDDAWLVANCHVPGAT